MKEIIGTGVGQHKEQMNVNGNECVMSRRNGRCKCTIKEKEEKDVYYSKGSQHRSTYSGG